MAAYFAYGSNMHPDKLRERCPGAGHVRPAKLADHRLAFTRRSVRTFPGSGVADLLPAQGMTVWGALYSMSDDDLEALDAIEGEGSAYERREVSVTLANETVVDAIAYSVIDKEPEEVPPSTEYLEQMLAGALACELPAAYRTFLESLRATPDAAYRSGLLVHSTRSRAEARGRPLVKVSRADASEHKLRGTVAVVYQGRAAHAQLCVSDACAGGTCEADQTLRHALGMPGRECYGGHVTIEPVRRRSRSFQLVSPRAQVLPAWPPAWLDSEKGVVVLHEKNIRLLGISEGDVVSVSAVVSAGDGYAVNGLARRVFSGSADKVTRDGADTDYPKINEIYLDQDARAQLGIDDRGYPVTVGPDVGRLFASRLAVYGVTLFLGALALREAFKEGLSAIGLATIVLAVLFTFVLVLVDIRSRVRY
ncbi:MAG: gamma-glutamylcyclotransferase family protein [Solirubrobacteraceae bacterium]